ncbi:MAG: DUF2807 domain-containing protein [Chloroflexaceae bacterium]|nr:DUF2807 domain-containing protein [Chloroflexaceae bacterium]
MLLALLALTGCDLSLPEKKPKPTTETEAVRNFNEIFLQGEGELFITQGDETSVTVEAEQLDMPKIGRNVADGRLVLRTDMLRSPLPIIFNVTVKDLNKIMVSGPGHVHVTDLKTDHLSLDIRGVGDASIAIDQVEVADDLTVELLGTSVATLTNLVATDATVRLYGTGDATLAGAVTKQQVRIIDTGDYHGGDLESNEATVEIEGEGGATLQVEDRLEVHLTGSGKVRYTGNPTISEDITGSGTVERLKVR